ncbi:MAG: 3-dehydroquinate synthase [Pyrinomonadaceae bacterium]|nr:3-dehydroquinate synthase [Pyrinomonadaceae bacterium]
MKKRSIKIKFTRPAASFRVTVGGGLLASVGLWASAALKRGGGKVVVVSNPTVHKLYGEVVESSLTAAGFTVSRVLMKDGEANKTLRTAESALQALSEASLTRTDAVIALGGGVVGDLAGFTASVYLRGVRCLQIPTTLLAMVDSSVGGKTGVNTDFGKNLIGSFHDPAGVLIDPEVLRTLPQQELAAGCCEVIKHSALAGRRELCRTGEFLAKYPLDQFANHLNERNFKSEISNLILANVEFKSRIVAGDSREDAGRTDSHSRKVLNLGHTLAHALERVTNYKHLRHGEAVGYGILFAAELSKTLALCGKEDVNLLYDVVHRVGSLPSLADIDARATVEAFDLDKKNIAGSRQFVLLRGIGKPVIVTGKAVPPKTLISVLKKCFKKWA